MTSYEWAFEQVTASEFAGKNMPSKYCRMKLPSITKCRAETEETLLATLQLIAQVFLIAGKICHQIAD